MAFIEVNNVSKEFQVYKRQKGFLNSVKSLFHRQYEIKRAVCDIDFHIDKGELVGYIGPNGAGKSTTIKMLSGILLPTKGNIFVDGRIPYINRKENAIHIGIVFGQRSQLYWDLPVEETFDLFKKMYRINDAQFKYNVEFYVDLLDMYEFLQKPVRQLSLGQKMRANLAVALLHDPEILYLDEPTIGLDVVVKSRIRHFIREVNKEKKITVMLTTHDMNDIEQICNRIIMIDKGYVLYDGSLIDFKDKYSGGYMLKVVFANEGEKILDQRLKILKEEGFEKIILFNKEDISVAETITQITRNYNITDLSIKEPEIEEVVRKIYESKNYDQQESRILI
ncbi:MAG: ATP-binding cassette domain-containing protein [Ignavibacterium sp.]|nr:MAG: ATP-binding cassette domain-containing protein [Ignavibacterium sp.]